MIDENEVVDFLSDFLQLNGYKIVQKLSTTQHGVDLIALNLDRNKKLLIEAKGGTSSVISSNRYGKPYTQTQVFDRVSKGLFTAIQLLSKRIDLSSYDVGLAFPEGKYFLKYLNDIKPVINQLGILVFIVKGFRDIYYL